MSDEAKAVINIADLPLESHSHGDTFAAKLGEIGEPLGLKGMGCQLHIVPPGKRAFPYHRHHGADELFIILSGTGEYRFADRRLPIRAGDCLGAPSGGAAHQVVNTGTEDLRYLVASINGEFDVVEYPDSGKVSVRAGMKDGDPATATFAVRGRLAPADYWDGE